MKKKLKLLMVFATFFISGAMVYGGTIRAPLNKQYLANEVSTGGSNSSSAYKTVVLRQLTKEQIQRANEIAAKATPVGNPAPQGVYKLDTKIKDSLEFYKTLLDAPNMKVLDQGNFGTCVTFSTTGLIGYLLKDNTSAVSQLDTLYQGYYDTGNKIKDSGWVGLGVIFKCCVSKKSSISKFLLI